MSYRITYAWQKEKELKKHREIPMQIFLGILALSAAITIRILIPQTEEVFQKLLHPLTDEATISAFADMVDQIGMGMPVEEAAAAFCMEIINSAQS